MDSEKLSDWKRQYKAVVELVRELREMGVMRVTVTCPRCGSEGSVSTLGRGEYVYLIVRHRDKSTHTVPKKCVDVVMTTLCTIKKNLEHMLELYKTYEKSGVKFCADGKPDAAGACP